ncbi:MAG: recombinase family protein [Methylacidiphilales bacterium]|nr:recombinase family protein [Candidatus Methylacidiphilales bacterium]NJR17137.1 recombinase family protein [Calothrix sp. CSU_2_0]
MTIAGYARVSSVEQSQDSSLEQQIDRLKRAGAQTVLVDVKSGRTSDRQQLNELLKLVKTGQVTEIIITRIDRLGRSVIGLLKIIEVLETHKVRLRVLDSPIDLNSPFGRMNLNQISAIAQFESELLSNRIKHGNAYARSQGKAFKAPFGYIRNKDGYLELDQSVNEKTGATNADVARNIVKILCENPLRGSCKIIYETYEIKFSTSGVRKWLENPAVRGHTAYYFFQDKEFFKGKEFTTEMRYNTHEAVMSEEQYVTIVRNLSHNRSFCGATPFKGKYPLAGLVKCGVCGGGMVREFGNSKRRTEFLRCGKHARGAHFCSNWKYSQLQKINDAVIAKIVEHSKVVVDRALAMADSPDTSEPPEVNDLRKQLDGLKQLGQNPAILLAVADIEGQIENLLAHIRIQPAPMTRDLAELLSKASQAFFWESLDNDFLRDVFLRLVSKVLIDESGNVEVEFTF